MSSLPDIIDITKIAPIDALPTISDAFNVSQGLGRLESFTNDDQIPESVSKLGASAVNFAINGFDRVRNVAGKVAEFAQSGLSRAGIELSTGTKFVRERASSIYKPSRSLTARIAAGALAFSSTGGIGIESGVASTASSSAKLPMTPNQMANAINSYYATYISPENPSTYNLQTVVLGAHYLLRSGKCNPKYAYIPNTQITVDTLKGEHTIYCIKANGKYETQTIRRSSFISSTAKSMDFSPVLDELANNAASSEGLVAGQYGTPNRIRISFNKRKHVSEADLFYKKSVANGSVKQLRELKVRVIKGTEKVAKLWYK